MSLDEIDLKDERFRISGQPPSDRLIKSIRKIGLVSPPVVVSRRNRWVPVSGWRRILACRELGKTTITVSVLKESDDRRTFLFAVEENLATRELTFLEKAEIVARLLKFGLSELQLRKKILPAFEIPPTRPYLERYLALAGLDSETKDFISAREIPLAVAQLLIGLKPRDRKALIPILAPLGKNKQIEIVIDVQDIARKKRVPAWKILETQEIRDILAARDWPAIQKSERVRQALKGMRFPRLTSWQEEFDSALRRMKWPRDIRIEPRPFFEDDWLSAAFRFRDAESFRIYAGQMGRLAAREDLQDLWKHAPKKRKG
jgi:ParB/RepB/Spo0J family partition protein